MSRDVVGNVGELIRAARKAKGLSQEALAYRVGLEQTDISKFERGKEKPNEARARKIAEALGLDEGDLFVT
jgi:ribosome-binding protein aMBF1 (putative translation factor)